MTPDGNDKTLSSYWSAPVPTGRPGEVSVGGPVACIATTYTFDAAFYEVELLPRFLGVKFDHTEREISFLIEREQTLGTVRACVLVDHTCVDARQTTLRWDQLAVRVPGGAQHAKIVVLAWERWLRIIVSSANLTRQGYRRNREIAGVLDFFDGKDSMPLQPAKDVLRFLSDVAGAGWLQAHESAKERLVSMLEYVRRVLGRWQQAPADFTPRELPRLSFVGGCPATTGRRMLSVMDQVTDLWADHKANAVTVLTPSVGQTQKGMQHLVQRLLALSRRSAESVGTFLVIPGRMAEQPAKYKMISGLPKFFLNAWNAEWGDIQREPAIYVVPPARKGEKFNRTLHAKAMMLENDDRVLLLCGSSNFSPHGMGVSAASIEGNLSYLDRQNGESQLYRRMPVDWADEGGDRCNDVFWPDEADPPEDECPKQPALPPVFRAVTFNEQAAKLTAFFDRTHAFPAAWSIARPGAKANDVGTILLDSSQLKNVPAEGRLSVEMPGSLRGLTLTCVRMAWTDDQGESQSGWLPVQTESLEDLLPPEQFRGLTSDYIMNCLICGREPAELVDEDGNDSSHLSNAAELSRAYDPLREIDTTGYALYQVRKLGQTLAALADRLVRTVRTQEAAAYRLGQDPLGPIALADALAKDLTVEGKPPETAQMRACQLAFSFAEIALTLAHACRRVRANRNPGDHDVRPIYRDVVQKLLEKAGRVDGVGGSLGSLAGYISAVGLKCDELLTAGD